MKQTGFGSRGTFVVDKEGKIQQIVLDNIGDRPDQHTRGLQPDGKESRRRAETLVNQTSMATTYVAMPEMRRGDPEKVNFTWWGGVLGPKLLTHVKCEACGINITEKRGRTIRPLS